MNVVIETERLLLRTFTEEDAPFIYELNIDPEVTKYTHDPVTNLNQANTILQHVILPQYALYNHGRWAVHLKSNLEFIGWCGLKNRPETRLTVGQGKEIDLGYRFLRKHWGHGYATESARACIEYGFEKLNLECITGRALPGNTSSIKVLEKCGMEFIGFQHVDNYDVKTYQVLNPAYQ
ncbi:MAG: GNAT family N-acetyltransferase [Bacteroidota bacterium]|nr:GNAT family N-acetyltransferase [Bacteroidota bacterium]